MLNQSELSFLKKGDDVDHFLLIRKFELKMTKTNKPYLSMELGDKSAALSANLWDSFDEFYNSAKLGDVVKAVGFVEDYQGTAQLRVNSIRLAIPQDGVVPRDFLPRSSRNLEEMKKEFWNRAEQIKDPFLKELIKKVFDKENFEKFSSAPAGKSWHHSYIHGLLEHTLEVVKICDLVCTFHADMNKDLLITGAMLHDFGKTDELSYDTAFDYTSKGKLIGHIVLAAMFVEQKIKEIKNFPEELKDAVIHLVLSHQGKLEHASPVVPKTMEAIVLYHADELSAKANAYKYAIRSEIDSGREWTKFHPLAETDLFIPKTENDSEDKTLFDNQL